MQHLLGATLFCLPTGVITSLSPNFLNLYLYREIWFTNTHADLTSQRGLTVLRHLTTSSRKFLVLTSVAGVGGWEDVVAFVKYFGLQGPCAYQTPPGYAVQNLLKCS